MSYSDKHLFFDLDRTLWDFDKNSEFALQHILKEEQLENRVGSFDKFHDIYVEENARLWQLYGKGILTKDVLRYKRFQDTLNHFGLDDVVLAQRMGDAYVELSPRQTQLFPNAKETLEELQSIGFQMHIITNGFSEVQYIKLENCGLIHFFDVIVCSEVIGKNKPDPLIFQHALSEAKADSKNSLMIGDDYHADINGAIQSGMHAILFDPFEKEYSNYEYVIKDLSEVPSLAIKLLR
jgi:putative hydrolase of the HAD superfamily